MKPAQARRSSPRPSTPARRAPTSPSSSSTPTPFGPTSPPGAPGHRKGAFETANRGPLFLDEIGALSPDTQTRLKRVIEEREYLPLGASDPVRIDVRLLAATTSDLAKLVEEGKFRMDYNWPGNVRELQDAIERAAVRISRGSGEAEPLPADASLFAIVAGFERRRILETLESCKYSQTEAAQLLRIPLSTLSQKIKGLDIPVKRKSANPAPA